METGSSARRPWPTFRPVRRPTPDASAGVSSTGRSTTETRTRSAGSPGTRVERFRGNLTPGLEEGRTLGWKLAVRGAREAEGVLSPDAFGHTGFTGTSVWIEPRKARIHVLLTNRVHPEVRPIDLNALRRGFHAAARDLA